MSWVDNSATTARKRRRPIGRGGHARAARAISYRRPAGLPGHRCRKHDKRTPLPPPWRHRGVGEPSAWRATTPGYGMPRLEATAGGSVACRQSAGSHRAPLLPRTADASASALKSRTLGAAHWGQDMRRTRVRTALIAQPVREGGAGIGREEPVRRRARFGGRVVSFQLVSTANNDKESQH